MNTVDKLNKYAELVEQSDFLQKSLVELKEKAVPDELKEQWEQIKAAIANCHAEIDAEYAPMIEACNKEKDALLEEVKAETLVAGATVKGEKMMAVWNKGRTTWDGDMLKGMVALIPALKEAMKVGEPTVSIRSMK